MTAKHKGINASTVESVKRRFGIIGNAPTLNQAIHMALRIAPTTMNVLITGENGSGKESFSKIIHHFSSQKHGKLIAVNCGALPEGTIDSELFGHERGAFTGAQEARKGYFEEANNGTIFLDEIGEMPLATQSRLLRVLEYGEFMKVGSSKVEKTEVRVIAATHVDLLAAVDRGQFREDLYYRLNTVSLRIPPLRERGKDVLLLCKKFAVDFAEEYGGMPLQLTEEAVELLAHYPFPGNIRELKNLVVRIAVLEREDRVITAEKLQGYLPPKREGLPVPMGSKGYLGNALSEREILYKVIFDMQRDLIALKQVVFHGLNRDTVGTHMSTSSPFSLSDDTTSKKKLTEQAPLMLPTKAKAEEVTKEQEKEITDTTGTPIVSLEEMEKQAIIDALQRCNNSRKEAAKALKIPERTLYRKIKKYRLSKESA